MVLLGCVLILKLHKLRSRKAFLHFSQHVFLRICWCSRYWSICHRYFSSRSWLTYYLFHLFRRAKANISARIIIIIYLIFGVVSGINLGAFHQQLSACLTPRPHVSKATRPPVQLKWTETHSLFNFHLTKELKKTSFEIIEKISKVEHNFL